MEFKEGMQLRVNDKWFFDVKEVESDSIKARIKFREGINKPHTYKVIKLDSKLFMDCTEKNDIVYCRVNENELRRVIGGLVDRLIKEKDVYSIIENVAAASPGNTGGMGAVSMPGLSGTPGVPGSSGSGDIGALLGGPAIKKGTYGLQDLSKGIKHMRKLAKNGKNNKNGIKKALLNVFKESNDIDLQSTDNDYKRTLYQFLDYPYTNEYDIKFIEEINEWRPNFLEASSPRIKQYFKDLYAANETMIKNNCSDTFQNQILVLGEIEM
jgi:hypothetical protein